MTGTANFALGFLICCVASALDIPENYEMFDGYQVLNVVPKSRSHIEQLWAMEKKGIQVDFWLEPRKVGKNVHMMVKPDQMEQVKEYLKELGISHRVHVENVRDLIEREQKELSERTVFKEGDHPNLITTNHYHRFSEIMAYITSVANTYPSMARLVPIGNGHSLRGRNFTAIKIGNAGSNKPAVWADGCIHAREWVTCATMIYIINELVTKPSQYSTLLNSIDIYIMPVANPDGYDYTWTNYRLWRKTRSGPRNGCYGVDPNRNWNYHWGDTGISTNPCSEIYDGPSPFSEVETNNMKNFFQSLGSTLKSYFNIHAYSEDWLFPYGYASHTYPPDVSKLRTISAQAVQAIYNVNHIRFTSGSITDVVYPASGNSIDYTRGALNIDYSFAMEMRPSRFAHNGFQLPANQIIAAASEAWAGIQVVFNRVASGQ